MASRRSWRVVGIAVVLLIAAAGARAVAAQAEAEPELSLRDALRIALERHPALQAAASQTHAAAAGMEQARAGFLPRVDVSEGVTRSDNPVYAFGSLLNQGRFTQDDFDVQRLNHPDAVTNWRTNVSGSVPLFTGGRTLLGFQQAQLTLAGSRAARERVEQEVIFHVVRAYAALLLSREAQETVGASVRTAEANLAAAETRYEAGVVVASDALAARVRLAGLREEAIAAASQVRLARAALNEAMGVALDDARRVTGRLDLPPVGHEPAEGLEALARERRPDYRQAALEVQRLEKEVLRAKGAFLPTLNLQGNYEINNHHVAADGQDSWSVGVLLHWNLFSGGADRARVLEAQAHARRAAALRDRLGNAIALEVRDAFLATRTARERVGVAREAVAQADESLRIVQDRYDAGLTTIVELLDSEAALSAARTALTRNLFDATVSQARLALSLGTLDPERF
jgi:outer membrane protein TolC